MAGTIRDRGCLYYVPWITLLGLCLLGGAIGVWISFSIKVYDSSKNAMNTLGVTAYNLDRPKPAIIATSCFYLFTLVMLAGLAFARSFIEAAHDATGLAGAGSLVWLVLNVMVAVPWWLIILWNVALVMACALWAFTIYVLRGSINQLIITYGPQPTVSWIPSAGQPCPGQCLNLGLYQFINSNLANSCVCDYTKLGSAYNSLDDAYTNSTAVMVGICVMLLAGLILLVNFACQYAHTSREREYIRRLTHKSFIGI